ncbi:LexA family protein [Gluconobacter cerinus]
MSISSHSKEHFLSDTQLDPICENAHMANNRVQDELKAQQQAWINRIKDATGKSYTEIARESGCAASTVYRFMNGHSSHCLSAATEAKIREKFGDGSHSAANVLPVTPARVPVIGIVQAGLWQAEYARPYDSVDEFVIAGPDPRYPGIRRSAFKVIGDSMNLLYPSGTVIIVVSFYDIGRIPKTGEKVIVVKKVNGFEEATVKEIEILSDGRVVLWPRSSNPEHSQATIINPQNDIENFPDDGCHPDFRIVGLVTQSIRIE